MLVTTDSSSPEVHKGPSPPQFTSCEVVQNVRFTLRRVLVLDKQVNVIDGPGTSVNSNVGSLTLRIRFTFKGDLDSLPCFYRTFDGGRTTTG